MLRTAGKQLYYQQTLLAGYRSNKNFMISAVSLSPSAARTPHTELFSRITSSSEEEVLAAVKELAQQGGIPEADKLELLKSALAHELELFQADGKVGRDRRFYTIREMLVGVAGLTEIPHNSRFDIISNFVNSSDGKLRWHGLAALGEIADFPDLTDRRRIEIIQEAAADQNPENVWHRTYAISAMEKLQIPDDQVMSLVRQNIESPKTHQELIYAAMMLLARDIDPSAVMMLCLRALSPGNISGANSDWRIRKEAMPTICELVAKKAYPNLGDILDVSFRPVESLRQLGLDENDSARPQS